MTEQHPTPAADRCLIIGIARSEASFEHLVNILLDAGVPGATVVESRGLATILREELPIFGGLAALLPQSTGSRTVMAIAERRCAESALRFARQLGPSERPILALLPLDAVLLPTDS